MRRDRGEYVSGMKGGMNRGYKEILIVEGVSLLDTAQAFGGGKE